jgi:hypothetical protein
MWSLGMQTCAGPPSPCRLARTLVLIGRQLGVGECFYSDGRFHFPLEDEWTIAISPEVAARFRLDACRHLRSRVTLWTLDGMDEHLAGVVHELTARILQSNGFLERDLHA